MLGKRLVTTSLGLCLSHGLSFCLVGCSETSLQSSSDQSSIGLPTKLNPLLIDMIGSRCDRYLKESYRAECRRQTALADLDFKISTPYVEQPTYKIAFYNTIVRLLRQTATRSQIEKITQKLDQSLSERQPIDLWKTTLTECQQSMDCSLEILGVVLQDTCGRHVFGLAMAGKLGEKSTIGELFVRFVRVMCEGGGLPKGSKVLPQLKFEVPGRSASMYHFYVSAYIARFISKSWIFPAMFNLTYEQHRAIGPYAVNDDSPWLWLQRLAQYGSVRDDKAFLNMNRDIIRKTLDDTYLGFVGAAWGRFPSSAERLPSFKEFLDWYDKQGYDAAIRNMIRSIDTEVLKH